MLIFLTILIATFFLKKVEGVRNLEKNMCGRSLENKIKILKG